MKLLTISRAIARQVKHRGHWVSTGIYKEPLEGLEGLVSVGILGLDGDVQVDRENHGGPDKAVYAYTEENYRFWEGELNRGPFTHGQFGENLTVAGMPDEAVHIGDVFRIGSVLTQVTQPRVPCFKLGIKMGDPQFVGTFRHSGRVGFYLRVLKAGEVKAGDSIERVHEDAGRVNICDAMLAVNKGPRQREFIEKVLGVAALSVAWRDDLLQQRLSAE